MAKIRILGLLTVVAFIAASCFKKTDTIKLGLAGPLTGQYAAFGEQLEKGAVKAVEHINAAGGINGRKIELVKGDDACDPKQAVSVANKLVGQDKVIAVIGHFCSSSSIPASEVYNDGNVLNITPASTNPLYTERGLKNVFRTCGRDDQQGSVAGNYIVDVFKAKRVVVLHDKDTYGQGLADATKKQMNDRGVTEVLYEGLTRGDKDFGALVTKIKAINPDVIYFGGLHAEAGLLVKQLREQSVNVPFISGDGIVSQDFVLAAGGPEFTANVFMTFGRNPLKLPSGKTIVEEFLAEGYTPEGYVLNSYAATQAVAKALEESDLDPVKAAEYLHNNSVSTVMGTKSWDGNGDLTETDYVMYEWSGDQYDEVQ